jgi:hypothetical protein
MEERLKIVLEWGQCLAKDSKEELSRQIIEKVISFVV